MEKEYACRLLYREAFCDPDTDFEDILFKTCYKYCKTLEAEGRVASMLFALPCLIHFEKKTVSSIYLYAAATDIHLRSKGYMTKLIEKLKSETDGIIFLRPANDGLVAFYKRLGFRTIKTSNKIKHYPFVSPEDGFKNLKLQGNLACDKEDFKLMYYTQKETEIEKLYFVNSME